MVKNHYDTYHMSRRTRQVERRELESCGDGDMAFGTCSKCSEFFFLKVCFGFFFKLDFFPGISAYPPSSPLPNRA